MNILYEQFPEEIKVNGEYYPIVTDFREWIRFTELVEDDSVPWRMKCGLLLQWYLDKVPEDIEAAIYALGDFLMCKRMYQDDPEDEEEGQQKRGKPVFSFSEDAGCIYAAFREAYGIDLQQIDYMHWWEFRSLFDWLPMIPRLNNGLCIVRLILEQSGIRTNVNGSRRSRELLH